jgi:hypothetical protein
MHTGAFQLEGAMHHQTLTQILTGDCVPFSKAGLGIIARVQATLHN